MKRNNSDDECDDVYKLIVPNDYAVQIKNKLPSAEVLAKYLDVSSLKEDNRLINNRYKIRSF